MLGEAAGVVEGVGHGAWIDPLDPLSAVGSQSNFNLSCSVLRPDVEMPFAVAICSNSGFRTLRSPGMPRRTQRAAVGCARRIVSRI